MTQPNKPGPSWENEAFRPFVEILVTGLKVLLDEEDYEKYRNYGWGISYSDKRRLHPYVILKRNINSSNNIEGMAIRDKRRLHRAIMNAPASMFVDHINGNTLDNRRCNLRIVTPSMNARNITRMRENKTSKYIGVSLTRHDKWTAQTHVNGKQTNLGSYATEAEAAAVRDLKVMEISETSTTNFPKEAIEVFKQYGARWAQEKGVMNMSPEERSDEKAAAPGEESWEKLKQEAGDEFYKSIPGSGYVFTGSDAEQAFIAGFDAAIELVAKPLLKDAEQWKKQYTHEWGYRKQVEKERDEAREKINAIGRKLEKEHRIRELADEEIRSLKATEAALREENEKLTAELSQSNDEWAKMVKQSCALADERRAEIATLRQQLAEATKALEWQLVRAAKLGDEEAHEKAYQALSKLKAPSDAGEGKE